MKSSLQRKDFTTTFTTVSLIKQKLHNLQNYAYHTACRRQNIRQADFFLFSEKPVCYNKKI